MSGDPQVVEQQREWDAYVASISGSDIQTRKRRLTHYLGGFNGAYNWTRCTPTGDLRAILSELHGKSAVTTPYASQTEAWNDALEKAAQIVERYNANFADPECGGAPGDIRALKRARTASTERTGHDDR